MFYLLHDKDEIMFGIRQFKISLNIVRDAEPLISIRGT